MTKTATKNTDVSARKAEEASAPQDAKRRPLKTFTVGDAHASVWARDHLIKGEPTRFYSVSFERSYRGSDGKYGYSRSFNPDDLGALMALCQQAGDYILGLQNMTTAPGED